MIQLVVKILLSAKRRAYFCKSIAIEMGGLRKTWPPYRTEKSSQGQNRGKKNRKYRKWYFLCIFDVFLGYFEGRCVFLSCRGPSLSQWEVYRDTFQKHRGQGSI